MCKGHDLSLWLLLFFSPLFAKDTASQENNVQPKWGNTAGLGQPRSTSSSTDLLRSLHTWLTLPPLGSSRRRAHLWHTNLEQFWPWEQLTFDTALSGILWVMGNAPAKECLRKLYNLPSNWVTHNLVPPLTLTECFFLFCLSRLRLN